MLKLIKYLKEVKGTVLLVLVLLIVQAWCELSLPQYTADLVDVGIQQGGIEDAVPQRLRESSLELLSLFTDSEGETLLRRSYEAEEDGVLALKDLTADERAALDNVLTLPMAALFQLEQSGGREALTDRLAVLETMPAAAAEEFRAALRRQVEDQAAQYGGNTELMLSQVAVQAVRAEYEAQGVDLEKLQTDYLLRRGGQMLLITLAMVCTAILVGLLAARAAAGTAMKLRERLFQRVVSFSSAEIDRFSTASLITRSTNDIQQIGMVVVMLLRMVLYAPIMGAGGIIKVSGTKTGMGWIIGVAVGAALGLVLILMAVAMPKFKQMQKLVDKLNLVSREILTGSMVIRAFSREKHEEKRFDLANRDLMSTQLFTSRAMSLMMPAMNLVMNGVCILIVWDGGHGIDAGTMQVGDMMAFINYTMQIVMSFLMIAMVAIMVPRAAVAAERIDEVLTTEPTIKDRHLVKDKEVTEWKGVVKFEDVSFHYPDAKADVLEHISFTASPGETTAIIGSTGSGKSTLLNLIPRFFDVSYGRITLDGVDIKDISQHKLRSLLGYVPQKGVLFSGDIESNLKFGGEGITDEQMREAAAIAQAAEFIEAKPEGYKTPIAQGGTNVSGGQKQRLSIARAIAKDPKVLLFDDSFSALDYKTDVVLRRALNERVKDATVIIVAQRVSTILHADQIIVLNEGRVAGIGTHQELMESCPTYQEIARSQLSEGELGGVGA